MPHKNEQDAYRAIETHLAPGEHILSADEQKWGNLVLAAVDLANRLGVPLGENHQIMDARLKSHVLLQVLTNVFGSDAVTITHNYEQLNGSEKSGSTLWLVSLQEKDAYDLHRYLSKRGRDESGKNIRSILFLIKGSPENEWGVGTDTSLRKIMAHFIYPMYGTDIPEGWLINGKNRDEIKELEDAFMPVEMNGIRGLAMILSPGL